MNREKIMEENWINQAGARCFPGSRGTFLANEYGAKGDGTFLNSEAIQRAIDAAAAAGGGKVTFEPGVYLTGTIRLKDGVHLEIPRGTTISGSEDPEHYPEIFTRVGGIEMTTIAPLILIENCRGVAVTGEGTIDGQGKKWWDLFWNKMLPEYEAKGLRWCVDYDCHRPKTLGIQSSEDVTVRGVVFYRAAHWTCQVLYSHHVTVDSIVICNNIGGDGPSTDGVDVDSSEYVRVSNSLISCNDDNFCLKAGRDADGLRVNRPCRYILIEDCRALCGRGLVTVGSETSGGFDHILVRRCTCRGTLSGLRFKSTPRRGGVIRDILFEDIEMDSPRLALEMDLDWFPAYGNCTLPEEFRDKPHPSHWDTLLAPVIPPERGIPVLKDITYRRIRVRNAEICCEFRGSDVISPEEINFEDVQLHGTRGGIISHIKAAKVNGFTLESEEKPLFSQAETLEKEIKLLPC